jgi:hypothetical protein
LGTRRKIRKTIIRNCSILSADLKADPADAWPAPARADQAKEALVVFRVHEGIGGIILNDPDGVTVHRGGK